MAGSFLALDDDINIIAAAPLFEGLSDEQLRLLAFGAERLEYAKGRRIFRQGDRADCGYVVAFGDIALSVDGGDGPHVVKTVRAGNLIGQLAMITDTQRATDAVAASDCGVLRINRSLFRRMLGEYPELAAQLHRKIAADLQNFLKDIAALENRFSNTPDL